MAVPEDPTLNAIDRFFDLFDNGIEKADRILNRSKYTEEQLEEGRRRAKGTVIDVDASEPKAKPSRKSTGAATANTAVVLKPRYRIVEAQKDGETLFVVTDGKSRTECTSRVFAEKILHSLEVA